MARSHLRVRIAELCAEESALREILVAGTTGDAADTAERIGVRAEFERIGALINESRAALDELPTSHRGTAGVGSVVIAVCGWRGGDVHPRVGARGKRRIARVESAVAARACADRRGRWRERGVRLASWSQRCHCDGVALMRETGSRSWLVALYDRTVCSCTGWRCVQRATRQRRRRSRRPSSRRSPAPRASYQRRTRRSPYCYV